MKKRCKNSINKKLRWMPGFMLNVFFFIVFCISVPFQFVCGILKSIYISVIEDCKELKDFFLDLIFVKYINCERSKQKIVRLTKEQIK